MDMMMPSMDGITAIRALQKINPQVKVIAVSGLATGEKVDTAINGGAKSFLSKPYTCEKLLRKLRKVIELA